MSDWSQLYRGNCPEDGTPLKETPDGEYVACCACSFKMAAGKYFSKINRERRGHWLVKHRTITEDETLYQALG